MKTEFMYLVNKKTLSRALVFVPFPGHQSTSGWYTMYCWQGSEEGKAKKANRLLDAYLGDYFRRNNQQ